MIVRITLSGVAGPSTLYGAGARSDRIIVPGRNVAVERDAGAQPAAGEVEDVVDKVRPTGDRGVDHIEDTKFFLILQRTGTLQDASARADGVLEQVFEFFARRHVRRTSASRKRLASARSDLGNARWYPERPSPFPVSGGARTR